jgi:hypothetical protein
MASTHTVEHVCTRILLSMSVSGIQLSVGKRVDVFLKAGDQSCSTILSQDSWVLGTIAAIRYLSGVIATH